MKDHKCSDKGVCSVATDGTWYADCGYASFECSHCPWCGVKLGEPAQAGEGPRWHRREHTAFDEAWDHDSGASVYRIGRAWIACPVDAPGFEVEPNTRDEAMRRATGAK